MTDQIEITPAIARKVLDCVDAGLVKGQGKPIPGQMCVEAAVCYALGLPHGDDPKCVSRALRAFKIRINDSNWSNNAARAKGMRRLSLIQLGSAGFLDDKLFSSRLAKLAIRKAVPIALRAAASTQKDSHKAAALLDAAAHCEKEGTRESALAAKNAANAADYAAAANAAAYAANAADYAAAANAAAAKAANAADYAAAANAAAKAANAADYAAAANAAAYAAYAADNAAAYAAARDKVLADFCEDVVQLLIDMKVPGAQWLSLTEKD